MLHAYDGAKTLPSAGLLAITSYRHTKALYHPAASRSAAALGAPAHITERLSSWQGQVGCWTYSCSLHFMLRNRQLVFLPGVEAEQLADGSDDVA